MKNKPKYDKIFRTRTGLRKNCRLEMISAQKWLVWSPYRVVTFVSVCR